jgi:hypothetical protein
VGLLVGAWTVLDSTRHDVQLTGAELDVSVPKLNRQPARQNEEEVVRVRMRVPDELAPDLADLDLALVVGADDLRLKCSSKLASFSARLTLSRVLIALSNTLPRVGVSAGLQPVDADFGGGKMIASEGEQGVIVRELRVDVNQKQPLDAGCRG